MDWLQAKNIVELGTSLGLSSFYLAAAASDIKVDTFEGNPYFVQFVESQKKKYTIENVNIISGNFDTTFPSYLSDKPVIDLAFIDGNHRKEATIKYTEWTMDHLSENAVIVLDDIHWSKGMFEAWNSLKNHYRVTASIDMYTMGILFFNKDFKEKRHLEIRPKYFFS